MEEEMKHIRRFKEIIGANVQSALDKAEDPEKMIRYLITEMDESLTDLKSSCAAKTAEKSRLGSEIRNLQETVERWENRAELAVEKGKEELAREALLEKKRALNALTAAQEASVKLDTIISECRSNVEELEKKLMSVEAKQRTLVERGIHAKESLSVREQIKDADGEDTYRRFSELEQRIERMEAEAQMAGFSADRRVDDDFTAMEYEDEIEKELSEMKKKTKKASTQAKA
jgi:phage shock protein A